MRLSYLTDDEDSFYIPFDSKVSRRMSQLQNDKAKQWITNLPQNVMINLLHKFLEIYQQDASPKCIETCQVYHDSNLESFKSVTSDIRASLEILEEMCDLNELREILTRQLAELDRSDSDDISWLETSEICKDFPDDETSYCLSSKELQSRIHDLRAILFKKSAMTPQDCLAYCDKDSGILKQISELTNTNAYIASLPFEDLATIALHIMFTFRVNAYHSLVWDEDPRGLLEAQEHVFKVVMTKEDLIQLRNRLFPEETFEDGDSFEMTTDNIRAQIIQKVKMNGDMTRIGSYISACMPFTAEHMIKVHDQRKITMQNQLNNLKRDDLVQLVTNLNSKVFNQHFTGFYQTDPVLSKFKFYEIVSLTDEDHNKIHENAIDKLMNRSQLASMWNYLDKLTGYHDQFNESDTTMQ